MINADGISFLNRDHIVAAFVSDTEIVVITTLGTKITILASAEALAGFTDELANDLQSNFVSIAASVRSHSAAL